MAPSILAHALATDLRAAIDAARQIGAAGVSLDPTVFRELNDDSRTARREIVHLLTRAQQPPVAIDCRLGDAGIAPRRHADVEREIDRVTQAMDAARGLSCPLVCCDLGPLPPAPDEPATPLPAISPAQLGKLILPDAPAPVAKRPLAAREPAFESNVELFLRELGTRADRLGVLVAFRASLASTASLVFSLSRIDCPWFGIDLEPAALLHDEWSLDETFSRLGRQILHVRASDARRGAPGRSQPAELGRGDVAWDHLIANLRDIDYRGPLTVDPLALPNRAAAATRGVAFLRERLMR